MSNNPAAVAFPYKTAIKDYKPPRMTPALDRSEQAVKEIMAAAGFGITEFYFARRLWHDFLKTDPNLSALGPERWAAGIFENFLEINEKRAAQKKPSSLNPWAFRSIILPKPTRPSAAPFPWNHPIPAI